MRFRVVAMTVSLAFITYLDRVCVGTLAGDIMQDLQLSKVQMGYVFSAFTIAYGLFEIPTAAWADRYGARPVVARIVAWWSAFTMATAAAWNFLSLLVIRFLFGAGEAGAWPCVGRVFSRWIPAGERGRVQGFFFAGAHLAGALTPGLVVWMAAYMSWRWIFVAFGLIGFGWAALWYVWFRDEPRDKAGTSAEEIEKIERERGLAPGHTAQDWLAVFRVPSVVPLCIAHAANSWGTYFVITWLPTYLEKIRGMSKEQMVVFTGLPMFIAAAADLSGGWLTDALTKRFGLAWGRAGLAAVSYVISAIAMTMAPLTADPFLSATFIAAAFGMTMFTLGAAFSICIELGKENSAVMTATMNTAGQVGGTLSPIVLAYLVEWFNDWNLPLFVLAALYGAAVLSWVLIGWQVRHTKLHGQS
ncbi:MAG: MFS transporter [Bryobacter sp.]|nr:MFS transporter [Bryobacter sp.]